MTTKLIHFSLLDNTLAPEKITNPASSCVIVGLQENQPLSPAAQKLDQASGGFLSAVLNSDIQGKLGQTLLLPKVPNSKNRVLLVGCGEGIQNNSQYKTAMMSMMTALNNTNTQSITLNLSDFMAEASDPYWPIRQAIDSIHQCLYLFDAFKTELLEGATNASPLQSSLEAVSFTLSDSTGKPVSPEHNDIATTAITHAMAINEAMIQTKNLGNMPANVCTPSYLAEHAKQLSKKHKKISLSVLDEKEIAKLKMGLLLSVTKGSREPPKFIILEYTGTHSAKLTPPTVLVGKGITFDTGGNSLKSGAGMIGMKYDMCGGATVLGVMEAVAKLDLPVHLVGLIPTCENMPGGNASRPDDIVTSMAGITVEILNTDAEGRLILADALCYAKKYNPEVVIDIATLTGACVTALGNHASGLLGNHAPLTQALLAAGTQTGDRAWELPLWEEYHKQIESKFADIANISTGSSPNAGTITAACFLSKFTPSYHWAHLDVAGTACYFNGEQKGATGRPVSLLVQYILNKLNKSH